MPERVVITGMACISCYGIGPSALFDAVRCGRSGIAPIAVFETEGCRSHQAAMIRDFDPTRFIVPMKLRRTDAVSRVALACTRLLFEDADRVVTPAGSDDVGIALGTFSAGLDSVTEYLTGLIEQGPTGVPAILFSNTVSNAPASLCAIEFGMRGPNVTFNQREASSLAAIAFSVGAIRTGRIAAMVTGGADCVEETFFKVHDRFRALSPSRQRQPRTAGDEAARPFDARHNGVVLGEGGYLVFVESAATAARRGARVYGEILGVGITASRTTLNGWPVDSSGLVRAMRRALAEARLAPAEIAAVVATANGSPELDRLEARALTELFGDAAVPVTSGKGAFGESGAAGAAGLILGLRSIAAGVAVPTAGFDERDPACAVRVSNRLVHVAGDAFLVNSVASGGTNCSLVVRVAS